MDIKINVGSRVWLEELNGPFFVKSIDSNKAHCSHEFIGIEISPSISSLRLLDIQEPDMGFWVNFPEGDYPYIRTSYHFKNDYSADVSINFFCGILERTITYFKRYNYSISSILEFKIDLECILNYSDEQNEEILLTLIEKYGNKLPRYYENSYMILSSENEKLLTFFVSQYGDESLQISILMIVDYIRDHLNTEMALKVTKILFRELGV